MVIDQTKTFRLIEERIGRTTNPRHLMMLKRLLDHARGEAAGDLEKVMATLSENPVYHTWGAPEVMSPSGRDNVRNFYTNVVLAGGIHYFEFDMDRLVVDDDTIVTEGVFRMMFWGRDAVKAGYPAGNPDAFYILKTRMLVAWPFDSQGYIVGEDTYNGLIGDGSDSFVEIAVADVPPDFLRYVEQKKRSDSGSV